MKLTAAFTMMFLWTTLAWAQSDEIDRLNRVVGEQGKQIDELKQHLAQLERLLLNSGAAVQTTAPAARVVPVSTAVTTTPAPAPPQAAAQPAQPQVAGFRFSGDFRYRIDAFVRGSSPQATGVQNIRQRYRLRFNADRDISSDLSSHMQLATGAVTNGITFDQDFAGGVTRHPFSISEAFLDYHPLPNVGLRGGKVDEVFADNTRFLFDDDVCFNGFNVRRMVV